MTTKQKMNRKMQAWFANFILLVISTFFSLLLIEAGFRIMGYSSKNVLLNRIMMADEHTGFRLKPNSRQEGIPQIMPGAKINSLGMRDKEYRIQKPENTVRILALGDSFAYGRVEDEFNFLTVLEQKMNEAGTDQHVEILNCGVPAYQPINELAYFRQYGLQYQPDAVLLCLYVGNDLFNNHLHPTEINSTMPVEAKDEQAKQLPLYSILRWSELYWTIVNIYARWDLSAQINERMKGIQSTYSDDSRRMIPEFWFMDEAQYREVLKTQARNHLKPEHRNQDDVFNLQSTITVIQQMKTLCDENNIEFITALLPSEAQVDEDIKDTLIDAANPITAEQLDFSEPQKTLTAKLDELNITTVDLLPAFIETRKTKRLYLLRDTHWNEDGNALAAEVLFSNIQDTKK